MIVIKHNVSKKSGKDYFVICLRLGTYDMMLSFKDKDILDLCRFYDIKVNDVYSLALDSEIIINLDKKGV